MRLLYVHAARKISQGALRFPAASNDCRGAEAAVEPTQKVPVTEQECFELAQSYRSQEKFALAREAAQRGLAIDPASDRCVVIIAQVLGKEWQMIASFEMFKKVVQMNPGNDWGYLGLGEYFQGIHRLDEAEQMFKKAIELNPRNHNAHFALGRIYQDLGDYTRAAEFMRKALDIDPAFHYVYPFISEVYARLGDYDGALAIYRLATQYRPQDVDTYVIFGQFCESQGRYEQAEELYKKSIQVNPADNWTYVNLGQLYEAEKRYEDAARVYEKALEINPANDRVAGAYRLLCGKMGKDAAETDRILQKHYDDSDYCSSTLRNNYFRLKRALDSRKIRLVCMQYPMRSIEKLKKMFGHDAADIIFIENVDYFKAAVAARGYNVYFKDMFAGDFGHCTPEGNRLLAEHVADKIAKHVLVKR